MTKLLAFSPAISGKLVLLPAIPGKLGLLPAISYNKKLHPASVFSDRLLQCSFSFFSFYSVRILHPGRFHFRLSHPNQSQFQALTPRPITISGSHTQTNHNLRLSHRPGDLPDLLFLQITITISLDQFFQFFYFLLKFFTLICIPHQHTLFQRLYRTKHRSVEHLASILLQRTVRLVFRQCHETRVEDKGISCDTGLLLIRFRDTAVDDEQLAFSLYRAFSILDLYRYMTVQDMRSLSDPGRIPPGSSRRYPFG